ncbi:MAG: type II secretion system protein GspM [Pseudomonadales bacterium]
MKLDEIQARVAALSAREKVLVTSTLVACICAVFYLPFIEPLLARDAQLQKQLQQQERLMSASRSQLQNVQASLALEPVEAIRRDIEALKATYSQLDEQLRAQSINVMAQRQMNHYLTALLSQTAGLQVADFSLTTDPLQYEEDEELMTSQLVLKQQLNLSLQGEDTRTLRFLNALQSMPETVAWDSLNYTSAAPGSGELTLKFHFYSVAQ